VPSMIEPVQGWLRRMLNELHSPLHTKLDLILKNQQKEAQFMSTTTNSLANLTTAVANETTVDASVQTLLTQLSAQIAAASPTGDNPAIDALVSTMQTNATALAAAVTTNTPAATGSSSVSASAARP
jgi:hypothetical protein